MIFTAFILDKLNYKKIVDSKISEKQLINIIQQTIIKYNLYKVQPGENVGM